MNFLCELYLDAIRIALLGRRRVAAVGQIICKPTKFDPITQLEWIRMNDRSCIEHLEYHT